MANIISVVSQKGGVGKTTTAINVAAALAAAEKETLLVDCDPQHHATIGIGVKGVNPEKTISRGIIGDADVKGLIQGAGLEYLKIIPSSIELFSAEAELMSRPGKEKALKNMLSGIRGKFEYIIIDSPPSLNLLTINAITAADFVLIPLQCEFYALEGLGSLLKTIQVFKKRFNADLCIAGILLTMFDSKEKVSRQIAENAKNYFGDMVFKAIIPRDAQLRESASHGKPLMLQDICSIGARCYIQLAEEIMKLKSD